MTRCDTGPLFKISCLVAATPSLARTATDRVGRWFVPACALDSERICLTADTGRAYAQKKQTNPERSSLIWVAVRSGDPPKDEGTTVCGERFCIVNIPVCFCVNVAIPHAVNATNAGTTE
eukprot:gene15468-biopygen14261